MGVERPRSAADLPAWLNEVSRPAWRPLQPMIHSLTTLLVPRARSTPSDRPARPSRPRSAPAMEASRCRSKHQAADGRQNAAAGRGPWLPTRHRDQGKSVPHGGGDRIDAGQQPGPGAMISSSRCGPHSVSRRWNSPHSTAQQDHRQANQQGPPGFAALRWGGSRPQRLPPQVRLRGTERAERVQAAVGRACTSPAVCDVSPADFLPEDARRSPAAASTGTRSGETQERRPSRATAIRPSSAGGDEEHLRRPVLAGPDQGNRRPRPTAQPSAVPRPAPHP